MIHSLKCWPEYFQAVKDGRKTFEIRKDDRPYAANDFLELHEYDPDTEKFTNEQPITCEVTYTLRNAQFVADGMVCMGLKQPSQEPCEWCKDVGCGDVTQVLASLDIRHVVDPDDERYGEANFCPNCGRKLEGSDKP